MSEKHTPGRLKVRGFVNLRTEAGNHPIASCNPQGLDHADEANARRLVACWNACEGIPTNALANGKVTAFQQFNVHDAGTHSVGELMAQLEAGKTVWRQDQARIAELMAQRDALLEALKEIVGYWDSVVPTDCTNDMHRKARAAIAKAGGVA